MGYGKTLLLCEGTVDRAKKTGQNVTIVCANEAAAEQVRSCLRGIGADVGPDNVVYFGRGEGSVTVHVGVPPKIKALDLDRFEAGRWAERAGE